MNRTRILTATLAATCLTLAVVAPARAKTFDAGLTPSDAAGASVWIQQAQLPSGAIASYPDQQHLRPYLGNLAAQGLAEYAGATGDTASLDAAWAQLRWYAGAEDADGVVTDYDLGADGSMVSTGDEDSTDAYAGTFLSAVKAAWTATPGRDRARRLAEVAPGIDGALRAIGAVTRPDGLTYAKPTWHVVYLMDQAETYDGLRSAAVLLGALGRDDDAAAASLAARRIATAVEGLWNLTTSSYDWAVHESGATQPTTWTTLYPDAMENAWAVAYGLVPPKRAATLMATITAAHPELGAAATAGYWPQAAIAYLRVKDPAHASAVLGGVNAQATATSRAWPYNVAIAGFSLTVTYSS